MLSTSGLSAAAGLAAVRHISDANVVKGHVVAAMLGAAGIPRSRYAEDNSSGEVEVTRTGFDAQQHAGSVRVYYWIRGQGTRATPAQAEERRRAFQRIAPVLAQRYRVSGGDGAYLTVRAAAASTAKKNGAGSGDRRFVVEMYDHEKGYWRTFDSSRRGHSAGGVRAELAHIHSLPPHDIRVTEARHSAGRRGSAKAGAKRNARAQATRYTMAQVRAANEARSERLGLGFSFFDKNTSRHFRGSKYIGPYSGAAGVFFVVSAGGQRPAVYEFNPGNGEIDFAAHASGVDAARALARQLARGS